MALHILMAQRKCDYPGQYAPEALACMSGPEYSDNPCYLHDARKSNIDTGEFDAVEIVTIRTYKTKDIQHYIYSKHVAEDEHE